MPFRLVSLSRPFFHLHSVSRVDNLSDVRGSRDIADTPGIALRRVGLQSNKAQVNQSMSCPDCLKGVARYGHPAGVEETIGGVLTYVSKSAEGSGPSPTSTIIFITDAFGMNLVNSKLLADEYAARTGYRVLVPDIIPGGGVPVDSLELMERVSAPVAGLDFYGHAARIYNGILIMSRFLPFALRTRNVFPSVLAYARVVKSELPQGTKLGAAGFCWGGLQTTKLSGEPSEENGTEALLDAHFTAHPAGLKSPVDFVEAAKRFHVPISVAVGDKDMVMSSDDVRTLQSSLGEEFSQDVSRCEVVLYENCGHGFAVRADPNKTVENEGAERATTQAVEWFKKHLD